MARDNWGAKVIANDPRINQDDPRVRAAAELIHGNDSIHRHHDLDKNVCIYCALAASYAVWAIDRLTQSDSQEEGRG